MTIKDYLLSEEHIEPETLRYFHPELSEKEVEKVLALRVMFTRSNFWENWLDFERICRALNGFYVDFSSENGQSLAPEAAWYGVEIARKIWPSREYSEEVQRYFWKICQEDGIFIYPKEMDELTPNYLGDALEVLKLGVELADRTVGEVQASKYLAIKEYIKTKREKELWA